uniref:Cytoplasmic tRNA 2-thiolation protein 2 n=1 Tax=Timema shepardi TaxID=629360 RepID=A0A7R9FVA2_TIMSH|nr:unnamed protein product [Timema shepardi]
MRDFTNKEVAFYNFFNKLEPLVISSLGTKADTQANIQKLTEKFVTDLQDNFPATVSTVFRTGEKLSGQSGISNGRCHLCQAPLDTAHIESSALQATHFSRMVSALGPSGFDSESIQPRLATDSIGNIVENETLAKLNKEPSTCGTCNCVAYPKQVVSRSLIDELLCYGCRLITKDMPPRHSHIVSVSSMSQNDAMYGPLPVMECTRPSILSLMLGKSCMFSYLCHSFPSIPATPPLRQDQSPQPRLLPL